MFQQRWVIFVSGALVMLLGVLVNVLQVSVFTTVIVAICGALLIAGGSFLRTRSRAKGHYDQVTLQPIEGGYQMPVVCSTPGHWERYLKIINGASFQTRFTGVGYDIPAFFPYHDMASLRKGAKVPMPYLAAGWLKSVGGQVSFQADTSILDQYNRDNTFLLDQNLSLTIPNPKEAELFAASYRFLLKKQTARWVKVESSQGVVLLSCVGFQQTKDLERLLQIIHDKVSKPPIL